MNDSSTYACDKLPTWALHKLVTSRQRAHSNLILGMSAPHALHPSLPPDQMLVTSRQRSTAQYAVHHMSLFATINIHRVFRFFRVFYAHTLTKMFHRKRHQNKNVWRFLKISKLPSSTRKNGRPNIIIMWRMTMPRFRFRWRRFSFNLQDGLLGIYSEIPISGPNWDSSKNNFFDTAPSTL